LSAVSYSLNLLGSKAIVYGIEPDNGKYFDPLIISLTFQTNLKHLSLNAANTMFQSFAKNEPITNKLSHSIASGLAPPLAGTTATINS
jgi:hypothetical protein